MNTRSFLKEFLKTGDISPRKASPPNRASSLPYEQPLRPFGNTAFVNKNYMFHFLSLCVFMSTLNIGRNIPLKKYVKRFTALKSFGIVFPSTLKQRGL